MNTILIILVLFVCLHVGKKLFLSLSSHIHWLRDIKHRAENVFENPQENGEVYLNKRKKLFHEHTHSPDYWSRWYKHYEYKIEGLDVFFRLKNSWYEFLQEPKEYDVIDGVVLGAEIKTRTEKNKFDATSPEDTIRKLHELVAWHKLNDLDANRLWVLSCHPDTISTSQLLKYIDTIGQRILDGGEELIRHLQKAGVNLQKGESGYELMLVEGLTDDEVARQRKIIENIVEQEGLGTRTNRFGVSVYDLPNLRSLTTDLRQIVLQE